MNAFPPYVGPCSESTGGYLGVLANRIGNPMLTDGWIVQSANAYDLQARSEIDQARALVLDRPYRHKRKARHLAQAHQFALQARALRELLAWRQAARTPNDQQHSDGEDHG